MKIYLAAPLFNQEEMKLNVRLADVIQRAAAPTDLEIYLPQEAGETANGADPKEMFSKDVYELTTSDLVVAVLNGRVPDEGTCWEIGYAYAKHIPIIVYKNDARSFIAGRNNIMVDPRCWPQVEGLTEGYYTTNIEELANVIKSIVGKI